jgi:hypothetical protein
MECGGLPPLFAARTCPCVLHTFEDASDWARQASPKDGGGKPPHSTWAEARRALAECVHEALELIAFPFLSLPSCKYEPSQFAAIIPTLNLRNYFKPYGHFFN